MDGLDNLIFHTDQNRRNWRQILIRRTGIPKLIAISQFRFKKKIKWHKFIFTVYRNWVKFSPFTPEFTMLKMITFAAVEQKSAYHPKYLRISGPIFTKFADLVGI